MKTNVQLALATVFAAIITSCNNTHKTDSKATADTLNGMKDSIVDSTRSITKYLYIKVDKADARFAVSAADGGTAEVELGKLAAEKGVSAEVKDFGNMMVKDHSAANGKLKALASAKGITLPASLSEFEQKTIDKLSGKSDSDFDKAYVDDMIEDHQRDIKEFEEAVKNLKDPQLKTFATETLPTLKMHLAAIQKVKKQMK